jgi:hypothetical protein
LRNLKHRTIQAINVERQNLKGRTGEREGEAGQDTDQPTEQSDNLPSVCESKCLIATGLKQC